MQTLVIKLSGNIIADPSAPQKLAAYVQRQQQAGRRVVISHGGGRQINELSTRLSVPVRQIAGRRITDEAAREVLLYTVGGKANRELVAGLRSCGIAAVGLSGVDGGLTTATRRAPISIEGETIDFGWVGEIESVDTTVAETLLKAHFVPVIGCLTWSADHGILNVNADTFALHLALGLQACELVTLMEPEGVRDAAGNTLSMCTRDDWKRGLQQGWIRDGMKPKLQTAFEALEKGVPSVLLTNPEALLAGGGTRLVLTDQSGNQ